MKDAEHGNNDIPDSTETTEGHQDKSSLLLTSIDATIRRFGDDPFTSSCNISCQSSSPAQQQVINSENSSIIRSFAPKGLEDSFQQLYSTLYPCLCNGSNQQHHENVAAPATTTPTTNAAAIESAAAFILGPRGCGKSLLLESVLAACRFVQQTHQFSNDVARAGAATTATTPELAQPFRKVYVNGIVTRGDDVSTVVYEIIRQLSEIAFDEEQKQKLHEESAKLILDDSDDDDEEMERSRKKQRRTTTEKEKHLFRLRKSTFTSNLSLLEETLHIAEADQIPILLILDELDAFATNDGDDNDIGGRGRPKGKGKHDQTAKKKQLLLYHLLDRVATPGSNLCFVGMTSNFATLALLEKRIRSRAEGTSKVIYVRRPRTYQNLLEVLQSKLVGGQQNCQFQRDIMNILSPPSSDSSSEDNNNNNKTELEKRIYLTLKREYRLGKDIRWFSRVLHSAVSLYRFDVVMATTTNSSSSSPSSLPKFQSQYIMEALEMMQANISDDLSISATKQISLCTVNGTAVDSRLQTLLDLSKPEVALVLSARRILKRDDSHKDERAIPLNLQRIWQEYQSFHISREGMGRNKGKKSENCDDLKQQTKAAMRLLERGVLIPSMDHSGGGPLQYHCSDFYKALDHYSFSKLPLHMPIEIHREIGEALKYDLLDCSTALKDWGKKY